MGKTTLSSLAKESTVLEDGLDSSDSSDNSSKSSSPSSSPSLSPTLTSLSQAENAELSTLNTNEDPYEYDHMVNFLLQMSDDIYPSKPMTKEREDLKEKKHKKRVAARKQKEELKARIKEPGWTAQGLNSMIEG